MTRTDARSAPARLRGMSAFITGASRGIGLAIAEGFAYQGADLSLVATDLRNLADAERQVKAQGKRAELVAIDGRRQTRVRTTPPSTASSDSRDAWHSRPRRWEFQSMPSVLDWSRPKWLIGFVYSAPSSKASASKTFRAALLARIPSGRFLETREVADLAIYLASHESDEMTGQSISLDGGMLFT